jgi:hypothetical protein
MNWGGFRNWFLTTIVLLEKIFFLILGKFSMTAWFSAATGIHVGPTWVAKSRAAFLPMPDPTKEQIQEIFKKLKASRYNKVLHITPTKNSSHLNLINSSIPFIRPIQ